MKNDFHNIEDSLIGKVYPGGAGASYIKSYYQKRLSTHKSMAEYDELFAPVFALILDDFPAIMQAAQEIRSNYGDYKARQNKERDTLLDDDDNIRAFLNNIEKATAFEFEIGTREIPGDKFLTITAVRLEYQDKDGKKGRFTGNGGNNGTRIEAITSFHELLLALDQDIAGGFQTRYDFRDGEPFDICKAIVKRYFSAFTDGRKRRDAARNVKPFATKCKRIASYLYDNIGKMAPSYYGDYKEWVAGEILDLFGLFPYIDKGTFSQYITVGNK